MNKEEAKKYSAPVIINDTKLGFWHRKIWKENLEFINQIDPEYFEFVARINFNALNSEEINLKEKQHAAMSLRAAYSQGLEVLFSFLFAAVQAPHCVIGWILKYSNAELKEIVDNFSKGEKIITCYSEKIESWENISNLVFDSLDTEQKKNLNNKIVGFAELWRKFAEEFTDDINKEEYNSIKHGLRLGMEGHQWYFGLPENLGIPYEEQQWQEVSNSKYGSSFYTTEKIDKFNFTFHHYRRNWNPEKFFHSLMLISTSIKNIIVCLNKQNGNRIDLQYSFPDDGFYKIPWSFNEKSELIRKSTIAMENLPLFTKEEIEFAYKKSE